MAIRTGFEPAMEVGYRVVLLGNASHLAMSSPSFGILLFAGKHLIDRFVGVDF